MTPPASTVSPAGAPPGWRGEIFAGLNATAAMLPFVLTFGYIVFGAAGAAAAQVGLTASVVSVVIGALVMVLASRARLPTAAPSASTALILGTLVVSLLRDPALSPATAAGGARLLACTGATVVLAGLLLVALGLLRVGRLARFVPQPVLAGFMNGVAILIVLSQLPVLLGVPAPAWARDGWEALGEWQWPPLAAALLTALLVGVLGWRFPRLPAPLLALVLATAAALMAQAVWPALALDAVGSLQAGWPRPDALAPWIEPGASTLFVRHAQAMATTALLLALIGGLESVLSLAAVDQLLDERTDPDRELLALGATNIVTGLFGGLFMVYLRLRAIATISGGGRGYRAVLAGCAMLALVFTLAFPLVQRLPTAVVAGIVVMLAWTLVDRWTRRLLRQWWGGERSLDLVLSLLVVVVVCAVTLRWGFVVGVGAGVLVAMLIFMRALNRSLLRLRYRASEIPSRRIYPPALEAHLRGQRQRIEVLELEGALFFGNAERLADEVERLSPLPAFVVLDLRRVSTIDATGAVALAQMDERLSRRGAVLWLAGVTHDNRHGRALREQGVQPAADRWWGHADADRAIEAAEARLLTAAGLSVEGLTLEPEQCTLFHGLDAAQCVRLRAALQPRALAAGERLFTQGDAGDALYLLGSGSVSVLDRARAQRFVSFSPGMCFGETAVLDGGGRTADAVADIASTVYALPAAALGELQRTDPAIAALVYRNLAQHLSERLRAAATAWRRAAG
jgi:MFS superfamily sulfate permease-like transporter/CRP-like cAMP-binding protein